MIRFYAGVPLVSAQGYPLGALCVIDRKPRDLSVEQLDILRVLARTVVTTLELHRAMLQIRKLAFTDTVTGIANRSTFFHAVEGAIELQRRDHKPFTLIYLDLDGFKLVNDTHGHATGDQVLCEIAAVLTKNSRHHDFTARIGGHEFALIVDGKDCGNAFQVGERIRTAVIAAMAPRGWPVTASVGSVCFHAAPHDAGKAIAVADSLMYEAKRSGKNQVMWRDHFGTGSYVIAA